MIECFFLWHLVEFLIAYSILYLLIRLVVSEICEIFWISICLFSWTFFRWIVCIRKFFWNSPTNLYHKNCIFFMFSSGFPRYSSNFWWLRLLRQTRSRLVGVERCSQHRWNWSTSLNIKMKKKLTATKKNELLKTNIEVNRIFFRILVSDFEMQKYSD